MNLRLTRVEGFSYLSILLIGVALLLVSCRSRATPTPTPTATPLVTPTAAPTPRPTATPAATPTPTPPPDVGVRIGERYHALHADIDINGQKLACNFCHVGNPPAYNDPLAQVSLPADSRACLSCHQEGSIQPFYGEEWEKAKVVR